MSEVSPPNFFLSAGPESVVSFFSFFFLVSLRCLLAKRYPVSEEATAYLAAAIQRGGFVFSLAILAVHDGLL